MSKKTEKMKKANREMWIALGIILAIALVIAILIFVIARGSQQPKPTVQTGESSGNQTMNQEKPAPEIPYEIPGYVTVAGAELGEINEQLSLTCVGRYTGAYVEDGTDEPVADVVAAIVENTGAERIEYSVIKIPSGEETLYFNISALPVGASVLVMEANRAAYVEGMEFYAAECLQLAMPSAGQTADFGENFRLDAKDGVINITNLTDQSFESPVKVFFKTELEFNLFLGGIAYSVTAENGIQAGQTVQILSSHYKSGDSQILYMSHEE